MPTYILCADNDLSLPVKIGYASSVKERVAILQSATWHALSVIRIVPGGRGVETWFHSRFRDLHVVREWFTFDPLMLTILPDARDGFRVARVPNRSYVNITPKSPEGFHAGVLRALGGTTKLGATMGLTKSVLSKWAVRGIPSKYWHRIIGLADEIGINVTADDLERTRPTIIADAIREAA